jgi:hypothetical protein
LAATETELDKIVASLNRERRPIRGREKIAMKVGTVIDRYTMAKYLPVPIQLIDRLLGNGGYS